MSVLSPGCTGGNSLLFLRMSCPWDTSDLSQCCIKTMPNTGRRSSRISKPIQQIHPKHQFQMQETEPSAHDYASLEAGQRNLKNLLLLHARMRSVANVKVWLCSPVLPGLSLLDEHCISCKWRHGTL